MSFALAVSGNFNTSRALALWTSLLINPLSSRADINTTFDIYDVLINHKGPIVSESGIKTKDDVLKISKKTNIKTFLIGESLLKNLDKNSIFSVLWLNNP